MSNNNQDWYDEDEFDEFDDTDASGKALVSKLRRAERAKDKRVKELEAELDSLRKIQREANITQVLSEKGVNPKIARFIPADVSNSPEEIDAWLLENGELFGVVAQSNKEQSINEDLTALKQIDATTGSALSPNNVDDMMSAINNAQSQEELLALLLGTE